MAALPAWLRRTALAAFAAAFFLYSHQLFRAGNISVDNSGPLVAVICLGQRKIVVTGSD